MDLSTLGNQVGGKTEMVIKGQTFYISYRFAPLNIGPFLFFF